MLRQKPTRYSLSDSDASLTATELRRANRDTKTDAMRTWFFANYEDPAESTPYDSGEGGYIYIWGGPYDPEEALQAEFSGLLSEELITEMASELREISWEWSGHPKYDDTDDYLFALIAGSTEHKKSFEEAIGNVERLLSIKVKGTQKAHLLRLLYANVITAIETYLSDVFISAVGNDKTLLRRFVESTPEFKTEKVPIAQVFKAMEDLEKKTRSYLVDVVWHHLHRVKPMFKMTLDIMFPKEMGSLCKAVIVRHDLVHRNGKTKDGGQHKITAKRVEVLIATARSFVSNIDEQLAKPPTPDPVEERVF